MNRAAVKHRPTRSITNEMVIRAQRGEPAALADVAECFRGIAGMFFHRRFRKVQKYVTLDDFEQMVAVRWVQYLQRFDPGRSGAATWSFMLVNTCCMALCKEHGKGVRHITGVELHELRPRMSPACEPVEVRFHPGQRFTSREREIADMLTIGMNQREIACELGLSRQMVSLCVGRMATKIVNPWRGVKKIHRTKRAYNRKSA